MHARPVAAAMTKLWVRALVAPTAFLVWFFALGFVGAGALESGHRALGRPVLLFDVLSLFAALIILPAWVLQPLTRPPEGPPRGGITPLPLRVTEEADRHEEGDPPMAA
jgi:hypothetical protein